MEQIKIEKCEMNIKKLGRTFYHNKTGVLYFNWSCAGMEFWFTGTTLLADLTAYAGTELEGLPWEENLSTHLNWPWLGVLVDDEEVPSRVFEINREEERCLIFQSQEPERHRIRIVKLTENQKAKLGIRGFIMEGALEPLPKQKEKKRIEFVGDSITCGFGNMSKERDRLFYTADENGWFSHAAIAARKLDMELSMVSVSGICTTMDSGIPNEFAMDMLYPYSDRIMQKLLGEGENLMRWDFSGHASDYVVINLGTNDATGIIMSENSEAQYRHFRSAYRSFLENVRSCNGKDTHIICALGSLDYYLMPDVMEIVDTYRKETGDQNVSTLRYRKINPLDGWGACEHPSLSTQAKMAEEITAEILRLEKERG